MRLRVTAILAATWIWALSSDNVNVTDMQVRRQPVYRTATSMFTANPAAVYACDTLSLSEARTSYDYEDQSRAIVQQTGRGHVLWSAGAESLIHLSDRDAAWGNAEYATGTLRDIRGAECIDYMLVAPYVLGDTVGGDLTTNRYTFGGGYSRRLGRWTMGVSLGYRAEIAYRNVDPRLRAIVSDLDVALGVSYAVTDNNMVGLSFAIRNYSQNCDLDFYNPINDINTLAMTGMGTYNQRFSGNTNKNCGYSGTGMAVGAQWLSADRRGPMLNARYAYQRIGEQLRNFNNITMAYTDQQTLDVSALWPLALSESVSLVPQAQGIWHYRLGTENIFGVSAGASYTCIGHSVPYLLTGHDIRLSLPVVWAHGIAMATARPSVRWIGHDESLLVGSLEQTAHNTIASLDLTGSVRTGDMLWQVDVQGGHGVSTEKYDMFTAGFAVARQLGRVIGSIGAQYKHTEYANTKIENINAILCMTF